jgi:Na+-transporting methylmalonyl-CoA/oxaloacetate decarboxylase gamma subunit
MRRDHQLCFRAMAQERLVREIQARQHRHEDSMQRWGRASGILSKLFFSALILSSTWRKQAGYIALMLMGFGAMLIVAGSGGNDTAAAVSGWGLGFLVLSVLLLVLVGVSAIGGKLTRVVARDVKAELADESDTDTQNTSDASDTRDDDALTDTERALIRVLRNNDIPPDIVAESIREILERRMGR